MVPLLGAGQLLEIVKEDLACLSAAGRMASGGDTRCIILGHLTRIGVWELRPAWDRALSTARKIAVFRDKMMRYGDPDELAKRVTPSDERLAYLPLFVPMATRPHEGVHGTVSF